MKITAIDNNKRKYRITFEDKTIKNVTESVVVELRLMIGKEVTDELILKIDEMMLYDTLYQKGLKYATYHKTTYEIIVYLKKYTDNDVWIDRIVRSLEQYKYVDNEWIIDKLQQKDYSKKQLSYELSKRLFDAEKVDEVVSNYEEKKALEICITRQLKTHRLKIDEAYKIKLYRYVLSKGFDSELATSMIDKIDINAV